MIFVGTTKGRVMKIVNTADPSNLRPDNGPILVEEIVVFPEQTPIEKLRIVKSSLERAPKLAVLTGETVMAIPLARCSAAKSCGKCVALQGESNDVICNTNVIFNVTRFLPQILTVPGT